MTPEEIRALYQQILRVANRFLTNARQFTIDVLQEHNPTYQELASIMHTLVNLVQEIMDEFDPMMAEQAVEYVYIMGRMGVAIQKGDEEELAKWVNTLDQKPFLP